MKKSPKKILLIALCALLALVLAGVGTLGYLYYADSRDNAETVRLSAVVAGESLEENGAVCYVLTNDGYCPLQLRQFIILSRFDSEGTPIPAGGSAYSRSDVDLAADPDLKGKLVQEHQVLYMTEGRIQAGKTLFADFFSPREETDCQRTLTYQLETPADGIVRVDVIVQAKVHADDPWQTALTLSDTLGSGSGQGAVAQLPSELPQLVRPVSYRWWLTDGKAQLVGLGSIPEKDIIIPAEVPLSQIDERYIYDPINGTVYPVELGTYALKGTDIRQVTFQDGVTVQNNSMGELRGVGPGGHNATGSFKNCTELTAVYNIPDTVNSMCHTFMGCTSLEISPELPEGVVYLQGTFMNCTQLTQMPELPEGVTNLAGCFKGCTSLTQTSALPDSVADMSSCFMDCTNLKTMGALPASVTNMNSCFENCTSLLSAPELPEHCVKFISAFKGCTSLDGTVEIPAAATAKEEYILNLISIFTGCNNLDGITVHCCENAYVLELLPSTVPVEITMEHLAEGSCPGCFYTTGTFVIDGLTVYFDHSVPTSDAENLMNFIDNVLPDSLKDTCKKLTFTSDLGQYNSKYAASWWAGFALHASRTAYVEINSSTTTSLDYCGQKYYLSVTAHELGHCYDCYYGMLSSSNQWRQISREEGEYFQQGLQNYYFSYEYTKEHFARAVELYFTDPERLERRCPKMYSYMDELFSEES